MKHPTKVGQLVIYRGKSVYYDLLTPGHTYLVTDFAILHGGSLPAIKINGGKIWWRADHFEVGVALFVESPPCRPAADRDDTAPTLFSKARQTGLTQSLRDHVAAMTTITPWPSPTYIDPLKDSPMTDTIFPALEIPDAPTPAPAEPESASVQVLRKLLEKRQADLKTWSANERESLREISALKDDLATAEDELAEARRGVTAAETAIREIEADIARLKGGVAVAPATGAPAEDGWVKWGGGSNPVPGKVVECKLRSDHTLHGTSEAIYWQHAEAPTDVVAYRVIT